MRVSTGMFGLVLVGALALFTGCGDDDGNTGGSGGAAGMGGGGAGGNGGVGGDTYRTTADPKNYPIEVRNLSVLPLN